MLSQDPVIQFFSIYSAIYAAKVKKIIIFICAFKKSFLPLRKTFEMSYPSIDKIQSLLASSTFGYASDNKKAAGRALGTFVEIITFYLLKTWNLEHFLAIERPLPEFANNEITHNVEFSLHGKKAFYNCKFNETDIPINSNFIKKQIENDGILFKNSTILDKNLIRKNACTIAAFDGGFINAYLDEKSEELQCISLKDKPFAMFECKRVGVEEGMKKGPQTIEKAKQGSYVARTVSALQRIRKEDGKIYGCIFDDNGNCIIDEYYKLCRQIIETDKPSLLRNFILTIGVISNHGNWFTAENMNKELKVLAQSYDWLVFLTDDGLVKFITELLINPQKEYEAVKTAFEKSYSADKKINMFTKSKIGLDADIALTKYFQENISAVEKWFNVISPNGAALSDLKDDLQKLSQKNYWEIY